MGSSSGGRITRERLEQPCCPASLSYAAYLGRLGSCCSCISAAEWGAPLETKSKQSVDPKAALRLAAPGRGEACVARLVGGEDRGGHAGTGLARDVLLQKQAPKQRGWEPPSTEWRSAPASHGLLALDKGV